MVKITVQEWKETHGYNPLFYYLIDIKKNIALRNDDLIAKEAKENIDIKVIRLHPG
jgi:hypothetical protein